MSTSAMPESHRQRIRGGAQAHDIIWLEWQLGAKRAENVVDCP